MRSSGTVRRGMVSTWVRRRMGCCVGYKRDDAYILF